jgi:RNA polymerase sigma-70 factor, ECF subfamily
MNAMLESRSTSEDDTISSSQGTLEVLDVLFLRYRPLLSLIAYRVLGNREEAEDAVRNCLRVAAHSAPRFEQEGAFRCWLAKVLIDEAVTILNKQRSSVREPVVALPEPY